MKNPELLRILACPACLGQLHELESGGHEALVCDKCGLAYPMQDGIPVMLVDEARPVENFLAGANDPCEC